MTSQNVIATLTSDYNNIKNTASGKVEYNLNSLQTTLYDAIQGIRLRGTITVSGAGDLQSVAPAEGSWARWMGVGLFALGTAGTNTPNSATIFPSSDPAMLWYLQVAFSQTPGGGGIEG